MIIWVDADSCPVKIRDIISKASKRLSVKSIYVANREIPVRLHDFIEKVITSADEQSADRYIIENIGDKDIVITRDIPLADELVDKGIIVLNDRGTIYTKDNIKERLSIRNYMQEARELGLAFESTSRFDAKDVQKFSNAFDKVLTSKLK